MSKILINGVGYDPIVATDYWSGTVINRGIWTPAAHKDAHINSIVVSMGGNGSVRIHDSAGTPIMGRVYLPSGTTVVGNGIGELSVIPSGTTIQADSYNCTEACSITIYGYQR